MLRLFIIFSSCFDKNLLEKWLEINDFGLDIIGRREPSFMEKIHALKIIFEKHNREPEICGICFSGESRG